VIIEDDDAYEGVIRRMLQAGILILEDEPR